MNEYLNSVYIGVTYIVFVLSDVPSCGYVSKMRIEITFLATCKVTRFTTKYSGIFWHFLA